MEAHGVEYGNECTDVPPTPIHDEIHHTPCESETHPPHSSESENMSELCATTTNASECISIERMSVTTTSPTYVEMPTFPCEERHHHHLSDSTICEFECIHLEGVSETPHMMSEDVDRSCEAIIFTNNLPSTPIVSSSLVQGFTQEGATSLNKPMPYMMTTMTMVAHQHPILDHKMASTTTSTSLEPHHDGHVPGNGVA